MFDTSFLAAAVNEPFHPHALRHKFSRATVSSAVMFGAASLALCFGLAGCGSASKPFASTAAASASALVVNPTTVDFGDVTVGTPTYQNISITNPGTASVQIAQLSTSDNTFSIAGTAAVPATLAAGASMNIQVGYDPDSVTDSTGQLNFGATTSSNTSVTGAVRLHGRGFSSLTSLTCASSSMAVAGTDTCTITLSVAAPKIGLTVKLSSNSSAVTVPGSIAVPSGSTKASFSAGVSAVTTAQTAILTATYGAVSRTASINLSAAASPLAPSISGLSCAGNSFTGAGTTACTVSLSSAATAGGMSVAIASNNAAVVVPGTVTVAAGAASTSFNAAVSAVSTTQAATLTASANASSQGMTLQLNAATPAITLSATSLTFGNTSVGTAVTKSVTITSSGTVAVALNSDSISGTGFSVTGGSFPATLTPGQAMVLTVQFDPTTAGSSAGQLTIASNAPTATVTLSGTGITVAPTVSAVSCSSNSITGALADACTVTLSGAAPTGGVSVSLASSSTSVTVPASTTVPAGATATSFTANAASVSSAQSVTLTATAGSSSQAFSLQLNAATPAITLGATSLSFGNTSVGTAVTKSVTITSSGTVAVTLNSDSITGTGFSVTGGSFPATLTPGQAVVLTVQFDPTTAGSSAGQLTIASNAPTVTLTLSGTGITVAPTVSAVSCSSNSITGALADACTVTLSGSAPTGGLSVSLASSSSAVAVPASVTVPATATSAAFTANAACVTSAQSVTLKATTGAASQTASLQLNAAAPAISLNASSISFGSMVIGTTTTQIVTLTSSGTSPLTVNSAAVTGSGFAASPVSLPATLNPGQSLNITLTFDPSVAGAATGMLTVASNSTANATATVGLSGTGNPHQVDLTWSAPSNSTDPVAGYRVYREFSGGSTFAVVTTMDSQTAYTDSTVQSGQSYSYYVTSVDSSGVESLPSNTTAVTVP